MTYAISYKISTNKRIRVYTIREYWGGHLAFKYRSFPMSKKDFINKDDWTQEKIADFIRNKRGQYRIVSKKSIPIAG